MDIRLFDKLESTNNYCKLLDPNTVGEFTVICARQQTAGIGQQGNIWVSEPYQNLTFSVILKPTFLAAEDQYQLTMAIAIAVADTVEHQLSTLRSPFSVHIKWPNDIYVDDSKICGTLVTNQLCGSHISQSICGIGLNVNQTAFPDWVPNPTSLLLESPSPHIPLDLDVVLDLLLANIQHRYNQLRQPDGATAIKNGYLHRLYRLGVEANYIYNDQLLRATITGIDRYGHLQLTTANGLQLSCGMKEIKFI